MSALPARRAPLRIGVAVGALLLTLAALELGTRAFLVEDGMLRGWRPLPPFGATPHARQRAWVDEQRRALEAGAEPGGLVRFDADLGWMPRAGFASRDGAVNVNAIGARGKREYADAVPEGVLRLVCFGDSFTFGDEVPDASSWPARLERESPRVEVLNFGCGAYGTDQALLRFRREGPHGARVALLGIQLENLGRNVNRYRPRYFPLADSAVAKPRFALTASGLELVPQPFASVRELIDAVESGDVLELCSEHEHWKDEGPPGLLEHSMLARVLWGRAAQRARGVRTLVGERDAEPFRVTVELAAAFRAEALERGADEALVVLLASEREIEPLARDGKHFWSPLAAAISARGVPVVDPGAALAELWRSTEGAGFSAGVHLGPEANAVVARELWSWFLARDFATELTPDHEQEPR